jgi:alkylation response protein AidB-like acyl-CoA dehydrogenase
MIGDVDALAARDELRQVARRVLGTLDGAALPHRVAADCGWLGLEVSPECGGAGAGFAETAVVVTELGAAAASSGLFGGAVLGVGALVHADGADDLLRDLASGEVAVATAHTADPDAVAARAPFRLDASGRASGQARTVLDAAEADLLVLVADDLAGRTVLAVVEPAQVEVSAEPLLDASRAVATVTADGAPCGQVLTLGGTGGAHALDQVHRRAMLALACDSLGIAQAMLAATVSYAQTRMQFDRPIGSFQAVKHACADMLVQVRLAEELVAAAVAAMERTPDDAAVPVAMAKAFACAAAVDVAGTAMQLHGGIGYTWESGVHRYLKRAALNRALYGSPEAHRRFLATRYRRPAGA